MEITGWVERRGVRLDDDEIERIARHDMEALCSCGGEFFLRWDGCSARDHFGIMPGEGCPAGTVLCDGAVRWHIDPPVAAMPLDEAVAEAVRLRSDEGAVALSGGVDSALVACLARRPCVVVGLPGSHDVCRAREVADGLDLPLATVLVDEERIEDALRRIVPVIPRLTPVDAAIATTLYFVAEWANTHGHRRILAGQGADELFGGYARYLASADLAGDLARDIAGLPAQVARDQAVAGLHGTFFSLPYADVRVVRAARAIPAAEKVQGGVRKQPLRVAAERYLPHSMAFYEKKAMQYGSGIWKTIQLLARRNGYTKSIQGYLIHVRGAD
ncbi:MAG: asparagine synthase C-terminal domain-containing protein [Methanomicrobiaceae archaeon]|nr:asparagine synthase C-terminal domain-containing protein [Methanomicrobiaceae archaeon]